MSSELKKKRIEDIKKRLFELSGNFLCEHRRENCYFPVIGEGSLSSKIMFIGEAPGKNEAKTGKPFCGSAGRLLDELLGHVGLVRNDIFITNIVKDRPPKNRDPLPEEIEIYSSFLDEEIDLIKPKVIATLGRFSMEYVLNKFGCSEHLQPIGKMHGNSFKANTHYGEIDIVVLYHPCVAVYDPRKKDILKKDISLLKNIC